MNNKEYINNIIGYLKDDRPAHAYAAMRRYMEYLGYTETDIGKETTYVLGLLNENDLEISKLQQELDKKEKVIHEILISRKSAKLIYYTGLLTGIVGFIIGFLSNNIICSIAGLGVAIVAITGIHEAKRNKW